MKLSKYAKDLGITYRTAWDMFNRNEIPNAYKLKSGTIIIVTNYMVNHSN